MKSAPAKNPVSPARPGALMRLALQWLRPRQTAMTQLLGRFVRAESSSLDKTAVDRFSRMLAVAWRRRGARVDLIPQRHRGDHVRVEWNSGAAGGQILVLGHLDTVYDIGIIRRMPFRVAGGRA